MSTTEIKLPLHQAQRLAKRLVEILAPHCERIDIVGSVRMEKSQVGDIEIVCAPKKVPIGLFGDEWAIIPEFFQALSIFKREVGKIENTEARYFKYEVPTGWASPATIKLDLFIPQAHDYYRQLAIRTGPVSYSKDYC